MGEAVYLAGKIDKNDWRLEAVPESRTVGSLENLNDTKHERRVRWRVLPNGLFGRFDYVGPFFVGCDHGGFHGDDSHGSGAGNHYVACCATNGVPRREVAEECLEAIARADIFFAWLDDPTAHGTLVEIGYALALKWSIGRPKRVIVCRPEIHVVPFEDWVNPDELNAAQVADANGGHGWEVAYLRGEYERAKWRDDLWFASALPGVEHVKSSDPVAALRLLLPPPQPVLESPAEVAFWVAWQAEGGENLTPQHKVFGGQYRLDFAHLPSKTAIEIDGLAYHNGQAAFQKDHQRQRRLTQAGWRVVRFTAKEALTDGRRCAREALAMCRTTGAGANGPF